MRLGSLGYRTDLIFHTFDGEVRDRGEYLLVRTPANPGFYWGNFLLFSHPPQVGDCTRWRDLFARELGAPPETQHQVFGWDSPEGALGEVKPFLQTGFRLVRDSVLTCREAQPPASLAQEVTVRALKGESDWEQALDLQVVCREPEFSQREYREFRQRELARYRAMAAAGRGDWYGAFHGPRLVADLGLFHQEGLGRFQSVETHPDFRRRGIAGTLVYQAGRYAVAEYKLQMLVIVAEQDSDAERLYRSLGYQPTEKQVGLEKWPEMEAEIVTNG
jgi:ribosomal protein S18 acetylase RimI-like enzyme